MRGAMSINLVRGKDDLDCGCSGPAGFCGRAISWALVVRNCVLAIFALATACADYRSPHRLSLLELSTIALASIAVIFIYCSIEQAIANQQRQTRYFAPGPTAIRGAC